MRARGTLVRVSSATWCWATSSRYSVIVPSDADLQHWAAAKSCQLLCPLGDRWLHVQAVGKKAEVVSGILAEADRPILVAAAYLHDVGYAPRLHKTGLHQLDGAYFVRSFGHERVACLVANHSESRFEISEEGLSRALAEFSREDTAVADALTYCDVTTGPSGVAMPARERLAEVGQRYEPGGPVMRALAQSTPYLLAAVSRVEKQLGANGLRASS